MRAEVDAEFGARSRPLSRVPSPGPLGNETAPDDDQSEWARQEQQVRVDTRVLHSGC